VFDPQLGDILIVNVGFLAIFKGYRNDYARNPYSPESAQDFYFFRELLDCKLLLKSGCLPPANQSLTLCGLVPNNAS
jgi:hypothetical protein